MRESDEAPVPRALATAWGQYERSGKGPKPGLSLFGVVDAAIEVASREGLAAVSMKRVADELGTATMSLYRYVSSKDELIQLMSDRAIGPPPIDLPKPDEAWRAGLSRWAWGQRDAFLQNSWVVEVPVAGPPTGPNQVRWLERGLRCLTGTGLDEGEKLGTILVVTTFVGAETRLAVQIQATATPAASTSSTAGYGELLTQLTDPERFPALTAMLEADVLNQTYLPDEDFSFGLDRILDGFEQLISTR